MRVLPRYQQFMAELAAALIVATLILIGGCENPAPSNEGQVSPQVVAEEPVKPARPHPPITFFGEFPGRESVPFESRPTRSMVQHSECSEGADYDPCVDSTGRWLVFSSTRHSPKPDLYIKAVQGAAITQVTSDPAADIQPAYSPDNQRLAFASDRRGNYDIWVVGVDGQNTMQLTDSPAPEVHPTWSPNGQFIAYCSMNRQSKQWEIWMLDVKQPGTKKFIGQGLYPHWSSKGDILVYQKARERGSYLFSVWTIQLVTGEPRYPTEVTSSATQAYILPAFSPDGRKIVFCAVDPLSSATADTDALSDLWVVNVDGSEALRVTEAEGSAYSPFWAGDGRIYFTSNREGKEGIWSLRPINDTAVDGSSNTDSGQRKSADSTGVSGRSGPMDQ